MSLFLLGSILTFLKAGGHGDSIIDPVQSRWHLGDLVRPTAATNLIVPSAFGNQALSEGIGDISHFQLLSGISLKLPMHTDI
jgi:hypothetical protein